VVHSGVRCYNHFFYIAHRSACLLDQDASKALNTFHSNSSQPAVGLRVFHGLGKSAHDVRTEGQLGIQEPLRSHHGSRRQIHEVAGYLGCAQVYGQAKLPDYRLIHAEIDDLAGPQGDYSPEICRHGFCSPRKLRIDG
jgi:hypothetical protein